MNTFSKEERLCGEKAISLLFGKGKRFSVNIRGSLIHVCFYPFPETGEIPVKVLIGCPKKHCKRAYKRNRSKRLLRECFRTEKQALYQILKDSAMPQPVCLYLSLMYVGNPNITLIQMKEIYAKVLLTLSEKLSTQQA